MVMSLDDFKSNIEDIARPNRFLCQIVPHPAVFLPVGDVNLADIARTAIAGAKVLLGNPMTWFYVVKSIEMPSRSVGVLEHKRMGFTRKIPGDPTYDDVSITFYNDADGVARSLMESWHEQIVSGVTNIRQTDDRVSSGSFILLEQMTANNKPYTIWKFTDVWPSAIESTVGFDLASENQASEFSVKFTFNNWTKIL